MDKTTIRITDTLAAYVADLRFSHLPGEVPHRARHLAIDLISSIMKPPCSACPGAMRRRLQRF